MTTLEHMLSVAPVRLSRKAGRYRCEWSVNHAKGQNAVGTGDQPFAALLDAYRDAERAGWIKP